MALLGSLLGLAGAYTGIIGGYLDDLHPLRHIPVANLAIIVFGLPVIADVIAWLVGGREPPTLARRVLD